MSNVLDLEMPEFIIEEDKSKQTHIIISKKTSRPDPEKHFQSAPEEPAKNPFHPYEDELELLFYRHLPDYKRFFDAAQTALDGFADEQQMSEASKLAEAQFEELGKRIVKS